MATEIPFKWITGLEPEAQRQIERNFLHLQGQIAAGSAGYDAVIDPAAVNNSSTHTYVNMAGLIAGETGWTSTRQFVVRLIGRPNSATPAAVDTAAVTLPGPLVLVGEGNTGQYEEGLAGTFNTRPTWDVRAQIVNTGGDVTLSNVTIYNGAAAGSIQLLSGGRLHMLRSTISGSNAATTAVAISSLGCATLFAHDSSFPDIFPQATGNTYLWDCNFAPVHLTAATITSTAIMYWDGGVFGTLASGGVFTLSVSSGSHYIRVQSDTGGTSMLGSSGGSAGASVLQINGGGGVFKTDSAFFGLTVTTSSGHVDVYGTFGTISQAGNSSVVPRRYNVRLTGNTNTGIFGLDLTGPCEAYITCTGSVSDKYKVAVRGSGVMLHLTMATNTLSPVLQLLSATDCLVLATLAGGTIGSQAYTIDVGSARCILMVTGSNNGYTVAGTNASTTSLVITESGAIPSGAAGGRLTGTYPNPTLAASGVTLGAYGKVGAPPTFTVSADGTLSASAELVDYSQVFMQGI